MQRRPATPEETSALVNPLRLRILRLCLDEALTNRQLADRLARDPGTVLHHVRVLLKSHFLVAEEVRQGDSGALEKPYRATGKSWEVSVGLPEDEGNSTLAMLEALREELFAAGTDAVREVARVGLRLDEQTAEEFRARAVALLEEYLQRRDPEGRSYGAFFAFHLMPDT